MPESSQNETLERLCEGLIKQHWDFYPTAGSRIGRHEYDGMLPDLSPSSTRRRVAELRQGVTQLSNIDYTGLSGNDRLSHRLMELFLKRELFVFTELRPMENNPMRQVGFLNVGGYVRRDYAPMAERVRAASQALRQVPEFLHILDEAMTDETGRPVLDMSVESYSGMARFYRNDLRQAVEGFNNADILGEFDTARESAAAAMDQFVSKLAERQTHAPQAFAIGSELYSGMLANTEGLGISLGELTSLGQANLDSNLEQLTQIAKSIDPNKSVAEIVAGISSRHPTAKGLIPDTRGMLEDIRRALVDLDIIGVPSEDRCQVIETPSYMRYAFAAMDSPGAMESKATESYYYVTPVEEEWTAQEQEEWLCNFNYDTLKVITIHEVYPGHFVHHLHNRYGQALPLINRLATSYAFTEGWAHYTEQMMMETDYAKGDKALKLTQLLEALVRNCRYMCSIRMHTEDMPVEAATKFFMENAFMGELPARREAMRGTFDPGYLNYTLGKLMILKLREDYKKEVGPAFSLRAFHDRLLSFGAPALPLLRNAMLANAEGSPL